MIEALRISFQKCNRSRLCKSQISRWLHPGGGPVAGATRIFTRTSRSTPRSISVTPCRRSDARRAAAPRSDRIARCEADLSNRPQRFPETWRRFVVLCRFDKEIPPPRVKLVLPPTDIRAGERWMPRRSRRRRRDCSSCSPSRDSCTGVGGRARRRGHGRGRAGALHGVAAAQSRAPAGAQTGPDIVATPLPVLLVPREHHVAQALPGRSRRISSAP